jgi:hypothetical protein
MWATIEIKPGINLITGKLKEGGPNGPMTAQTYRFEMDKFTVDQAKAWLKKHKIKPILFEPGKAEKKEVKETSMIANIAPRVTEKCWGSVMVKRRKKMGIADQAFAKSIVSEVTAGLFEGGAGSGNWGHKGRPGMRGGSIGGGKGKAGGGGKVGGISAHKITVGGEKSHARDYYNAAGKLDAANYSKLSGANKTQVLKHGIQKYNESYIPKAQQGKLDANGLSANKKIGALEGMRRAAVNKAKSSTGKESRAAMHVAISLQARANAVFSQIKASGSKAVGSAKGAGSQVVGAGLTAVKTAARPVGR